MPHYFRLRARTLEGKWYTFDLTDVPVMIQANRAILTQSPNSPILNMEVVLRGEWEYGLFEGDVIESNGVQYLVCYERGFYAISADYVTKYLYQLSAPIKVIGVAGYGIEFPIPYKIVKQHIFSVGTQKFTINNIMAGYKDKVLLRTKKFNAQLDEVCQECCMKFHNKSVTLGKYIDDYGTPNIVGGRICVETDTGYLDLATGGILDGYISKDAG